MFNEKNQNEEIKTTEVAPAQEKETLMSKIKKIFAIVWPWAVLALAIGGYYFFYGHSSVLTLEQAKAKAEDFINKNLVQPGITASIGKITEEDGLYKIDLTVGSQEYVSYMTRDGSKLFTSAIDMAADQEKAVDESQAIAKSDKPEIQLFVMSYCPYCLQMEKGLVPVLNLLGSKVNFQLEFVSYAMHGEKEINENLAQYCIQKEEPEKLLSYLSCFDEGGDSSGCLKSQKIDTSKLSACTTLTDKQFEIKKKFADQSLWVGNQYPPFDVDKADNEKYNVSGSPTLVINGTVAKDAARDSAGLLELICSTFNSQPEECSQSFPSASASE
jgi:thiol-disulfide isomerase/thioredoxin